MVYQNKLVAAIKVNGQILRESGDTVSIPFGSEYSVFLKNLNSVRVQVKVSIDGTDATDGTWLIIGPNSSIDLERFIRNGNWQSGNRFKFIESTREVKTHRGIKADDGIVRVEYQTERVRPVIDIPRIREYDVPVPRPRPWDYPWDRRRPRPYYGAMRAIRASAKAGPVTQRKAMHPTGRRDIGEVEAAMDATMDCAFNDAGITVPGSQSNQTFHQAEWFETTGQSEVLILRLRGKVAGKVVVKPVTVKAKPECITCGKTNSPDAAFCSKCGTSLCLI